MPCFAWHILQMHCTQGGRAGQPSFIVLVVQYMGLPFQDAGTQTAHNECVVWGENMLVFD